jgi:hypothetical protein
MAPDAMEPAVFAVAHRSADRALRQENSDIKVTITHSPFLSVVADPLLSLVDLLQCSIGLSSFAPF